MRVPLPSKLLSLAVISFRPCASRVHRPFATHRPRSSCAMLWRNTHTQAQQPKAISTRRGETVELPGGVSSTDLWFTVPLRWNEPRSKETIEVFARELVLTSAKDDDGRRRLLFLQGGPGFPAPRVGSINSLGWVSRALQEFRVVLLDQRGTGRSSPVTAAAVSGAASPAAAAERLRHFRAPEIVRDCEAVRRALHTAKWGAVLGQSFGGFCLLTYLSFFPEAIGAALFTGGLPPARAGTADDVYRATFARVAARNRRYYARYPGDAAKVKAILKFLRVQDVQLPSGGVLTPRRFLQLGLGLGGGGFFETLHYLVSEAFVDGELSLLFLRQVDSMQPFDTNPLYAVLHEAIYCSGAGDASRWAAARILEGGGGGGGGGGDGASDTTGRKGRGLDPALREAFDWEAALEDDARPAFFTGEMVWPWMFEDYASLRGLAAAADLLAAYDGWSELYDAAVLRRCRVPCAALVYVDDAYVERIFSEETAALLPTMKTWVTNEFQHSGLRDDGARVFDRLLGMARGTVDIPS